MPIASQDSSGAPANTMRWKLMNCGLIWSGLTQAPPERTKAIPR